MAYGYRPVNRDQPFLLPPDMREWLPAGHLAWFVIDVMGALDLARFAARATPRGSAAGRPAYDPRVLLGLLVYGYARGLRSSRRIERRSPGSGGSISPVRRRWRACSGRCWRWRRGRGWAGSG